jgi:hypothetical protein
VSGTGHLPAHAKDRSYDDRSSSPYGLKATFTGDGDSQLQIATRSLSSSMLEKLSRRASRSATPSDSARSDFRGLKRTREPLTQCRVLRVVSVRGHARASRPFARRRGRDHDNYENLKPVSTRSPSQQVCNGRRANVCSPCAVLTNARLNRTTGMPLSGPCRPHNSTHHGTRHVTRA